MLNCHREVFIIFSFSFKMNQIHNVNRIGNIGVFSSYRSFIGSYKINRKNRVYRKAGRYMSNNAVLIIFGNFWVPS